MMAFIPRRRRPMPSSVRRGNRLLPFLLSALLFLLLSGPPASAADHPLRLPVGDADRRDRQVTPVVDGVLDTRTGEVLTPDGLARRLAGSGVRLVLVGEGHTSMEDHRAQLALIEALAEALGDDRPLLIGLEMYPYTAQESLDHWTAGHLTEEGFVTLSHWYEHWGYPWGYYREIFLFARDRGLPLVALNVPRELVAAVREAGLDGLAPEMAAHAPPRVDLESDEHRRLFRSYFSGDDPAHGGGMDAAAWEGMFAAQATWDAAMAHHAVRALEAAPEGAVLVVLVGSGHVAYGLGIARQARPALGEAIATVIPVAVGEGEGDDVGGDGPEGDRTDGDGTRVQASYADYLWGVPPEAAPRFPSLGLSTREGTGPDGEPRRVVLFASPGSRAEEVGFAAGDVILTLDGEELRDKETLSHRLAAKAWGDPVRFTVLRGEGSAAQVLTLETVFRRSGP